MANGITYQTPTVTSLDIKVYGDFNNISLAAGIYAWFKEYEKFHGDIDLSIVANLLNSQLSCDFRKSLFKNDGCIYKSEE